MNEPIAIPGARHLHSGKVRDMYELEDGNLLIVASDRISAYDYVLDSLIPDKGRILTQLSLWWFDKLSRLVPNHLVSTDVPDIVAGRAMVCERLEMFPVECVARGYLTGSGLISYRDTGEVSGIELPDGLDEASRLTEPIFTPSTKAPLGEHDEEVDYDEVVDIVGEDIAQELRTLTMVTYERAQAVAADAGLILADTKFEFGARPDGTIVLADEVLTPDSSRYWSLADWEPGKVQESFDKQIVRNWLTGDSGWIRDSGELPPPLPEEVVEKTRQRYVEAYELLTGQRFI